MVIAKVSLACIIRLKHYPINDIFLFFLINTNEILTDLLISHILYYYISQLPL